MRIPDKIKKIRAYDPSEKKVAVKLDANESFLSLPNIIKAEISMRMLDMDYNRYPDPSAKKVNEYAAKLYGVQPNEIVAGNGSDEIIGVILNGFCPKGSKVMIVEPDFSMYRFYGDIYEVQTISAWKNDSYEVDVNSIIEMAQEEKPGVLIFSNPCNPVGTGILKEDILLLIQSLPEILVIIDEAYMEFWTESVLDVITSYENAVVLKTMSKAIGMASIRLGFAIGNTKIISEINKIRSPFNINSLTQMVAEVALKNPIWIEGQIAVIKENKYRLERALAELTKIDSDIQICKSYTNFIVLKTKRNDELYYGLLDKGVCVRNFTDLNILRITVGNENENKQLLMALESLI